MATPVSTAPAFPWPTGFDRIPDDGWAREPLDEMGLNYDGVGEHGWYSNLDPLVAQVLAALGEKDLMIDYSGGTGLVTKRVLANVDFPVGIVNVDPSAKFLRVAVENFRDDGRVAFRLLRWLRDEKRLESLDEVLGADAAALGAKVLTAANSIHLYDDLDATLASWARVLQPGALALVCSANIDDPNSAAGDWIIDATVAKVNEIVAELVEREPAFEEYRETLEDPERMAGHLKLRDKVFVPVRPLDLYLEAFEKADFSVLHTFNSTIAARVDEWSAFLRTYHDGVLSWVGGSPKVEGAEPSDRALRDRRFLIDYALEKLFSGQTSFPCNWTYLTCRR